MFRMLNNIKLILSDKSQHKVLVIFYLTINKSNFLRHYIYIKMFTILIPFKVLYVKLFKYPTYIAHKNIYLNSFEFLHLTNTHHTYLSSVFISGQENRQKRSHKRKMYTVVKDLTRTLCFTHAHTFIDLFVFTWD